MQDREIKNESISKDDHHRRIIDDATSKAKKPKEEKQETSITETRIDSYRYYHLSETSDIKVLKPSIPKNFMTDKKYEDGKTPRVCFAPSIDQCLMAMAANITGKEYYVYTPYNIDKNKLKHPAINQVPDCKITGEVWSLEPVRVKCVGKIKVINATDVSHTYKYGNSVAELYEWNYKILFDESGIYEYEDDVEPMIVEEDAVYSEENCYPVFIILQHSGSPLSRIIKFSTNHEYTHAAISFEPTMDPMYTFGNAESEHPLTDPAFVVQNPKAEIFKKNKTKFAVYVMYVNKKSYDAMVNTLNIFISRKNELKYDFVNLITTWLGIQSEKSERYFCSKFVAKIIDAGVKLNKVPSLWKPYDFIQLKNISLVNKGEDFKKYNSRITLANMDHIKEGEYDKINLLEAVASKPVYNNQLSNSLHSHSEVPFELPEDLDKPDIYTLLDNTDPSHIYLSSDWHFFKDHYKREANSVNTREIVKWCKSNITDNDVFIYLGDISFRYADIKDQEASQRILKSIPGKKVLILGNHDKMLGQEYFVNCGFDYVFEDLTWQKYIFTHRPIRMDTYPEEMLNIHGHIHNLKTYNTCDGSRNVNVYPSFYDNKPVTLEYIINHWQDLVKDNTWNPNYGYGEMVSYIQLGRTDGKMHMMRVLEAASNNPKPVVFFSQEVDSKTIAYMVSLFKDHIGVNTAIKVHFGETGNKNFLNPKLLKDLVKYTNASLVDSNTAYEGSTRGNTIDHINTARNNGFTFAHIDILDADGEIKVSVPQRYQIENELRKLNNGEPEYNCNVSRGRHLQEISLGSHIKNYDSLIVYTHFKGHDIAGYGGAVKNIGMGIPSKHGKMEIHDSTWEKGPIFLERLVESASAVQSLFHDRIVYVNVLQNMSTKCDCDKDAPSATIPNIGVLVSSDLLAIEQASLDFVRNAPKNKALMEVIGTRSGYHQIEYMDWLHMGSKQYILRDLSNNRIQLENSFVQNENMVINKKDVEYRVDEFKDGDLNTAIVVGFSGSGKSTLGRKLANVLPNTEHYELDDLLCQWNFSDDNIKEYGDLFHSFFNGIGKKYRVSYDDLCNNHIDEDHYEKPLLKDFIEYTKNYAKTHKNKKFVIEGVWPLLFKYPAEYFKDWCVIIKGTSYLTSEFRATKRDMSDDPNAWFGKAILNFIRAQRPSRISRITIPMNRTIDAWNKYFSKPVHEETKRSELPDSAFGIPEDRKYPLDTEKHVKSAIHLFGHAEDSKKKSLARRIQAAARKYNISIPETTQCYKYLHESMSDIVPDNINTVIFDFGSVLVGSRTVSALMNHPKIPNELCVKIKDFMYNTFFYCNTDEEKRIVQMLSVDDAKQRFRQCAPAEFVDYCDYIFECFHDAVYEYDYVDPLLNAFRQRGYKLYYLSNWDKYSYDLEKEMFDKLCAKFDGGLFSFEIDRMKPDLDMYKTLLGKYSIDPRHAIFFDDRHENVEAARSLGMSAYLFDNNRTPNILLGEAISLPDNSDDYILAMTDGGFTNIPVRDITWWYLSESEHPSNIDSDCYYSTLEDCVFHKLNDNLNNGYFTDNLYLTEYVYISNLSLNDDKQNTEEHKLVKLGEINIFESGDFEWTVQLPVKMIDRELMPIKEWSMAATNPVIGITKPFVINTGEKIGFMTDIESDKYLTTNDDGVLEVYPIEDTSVDEVYEFVGNSAFVDRLNSIYKAESKIDNIYTVLTNKPLLSLDQLDFDPSFKKIDFDLLEQKAISNFVTLRDSMMEACGTNINIFRPTLESTIYRTIPAFVSKYNTLGDIHVKEDFDGVYFYSDLTKKRSGSVASTSLLTENMIKSIL